MLILRQDQQQTPAEYMSPRVRPLLFAIATCIIGCNSEESRDDSSANDSADPVVIEDSHIDDLPTRPSPIRAREGCGRVV